MEFEHKVMDYLADSEFSSAISVKISHKEKKIPMRIEFLENLIIDKNIIHVGCTDHVPLIANKIKNNTWLHKRLEEKARKCIGVDIDNEAVKYVNKLGFQNIYTLDLIKDGVPEIIKKNHWDFLILGEILEHIVNPVEFLSLIREKYSQYVERIIITVPYAFRLKNFINALKHTEYINSDHKFWFTPYTLAKLLHISNYKVESFQICLSYKISRTHLFSKFLLSRYPSLRDNLIMIAKL